MTKTQNRETQNKTLKNTKGIKRNIITTITITTQTHKQNKKQKVN